MGRLEGWRCPSNHHNQTRCRSGMEASTARSLCQARCLHTSSQVGKDAPFRWALVRYSNLWFRPSWRCSRRWSIGLYSRGTRSLMGHSLRKLSWPCICSWVEQFRGLTWLSWCSCPSDLAAWSRWSVRYSRWCLDNACASSYTQPQSLLQ